MGNTYTDDAYKDLIYKHPRWRETADEYEQGFAANLYKTNYVQAAARTALLKLSGMLKAYYGVKDLKDQLQGKGDEVSALSDIAERISGEKLEGKQVLEEALLPRAGQDSSTGAGQIGNARSRVSKPQAGPDGTVTEAQQQEYEDALTAASQQNYENIGAVINGDGNLREQMTMLYNGMFINGGHKKEQIASNRSLKNMLLNITPEDLGQMRMAGAMAGDENVAQAQVRFDLLEEMNQYKKGEDLFDTYSIGRDLKRGKDKGKGRGNAISRWWAGVKRGLSATLGNYFKKSSRKKKDRQGLGLAHYEGLGIGPSERERANALDENGNLKWLEGQAYYKMKTPVTAEGMLQTAGASGTTLRMMGAYKLLGATKQELLHFRLALMAWMVTSKDHSIYEILRGSHNAGVRGYEDMSEAVKMYKSIDPLSDKEIRELAPNHRYPHEYLYLDMLNGLRYTRRANMTEANLKAKEEAEKEGKPLTKRFKETLDLADGAMFKPNFTGKEFDERTEEDYNAFSYDASDLALNIYSTSMYKIMNTAQKYGSFVGHQAMKRMSVDSFKKSELEDKDVADGIYNLGRLSSRIAMDALEEGSTQESPNAEIEQYDIRKGPKPKNLGTSRETEEDRLTEERNRQYRERFSSRKQAYRGFTFRGGKVEKGFRQEGAVLAFSNLTSTSMDPRTAKTFYTDASGPRESRTIVRFRLTGKGAVSIMDVSQFDTEYEVLVTPGSQFRVTKALQPAYFNTRSMQVYFGDELPGDSKETAEMEGVEFLEEDGSAKSLTAKPPEWRKLQMVELEEIAGVGEDRRSRLNAKREKREETRRRLLAVRNQAPLSA